MSTPEERKEAARLMGQASTPKKTEAVRKNAKLPRKLLDLAVASNVRLTSDWLAVDSLAIDLSCHLDHGTSLISLCENLSEIIQIVQKGGHFVERLELRNVLDQETNPSGDNAFVRVLFKRKNPVR